MSTFEQGSTFATFKAFEDALKTFSGNTTSTFVKASSMKMKQASLNHLVYENVRYVCKQGIAYHAPTSSGARPNQKSVKTGCPATFRLCCKRPEDGAAYLKISTANFEHIHNKVSSHDARMHGVKSQSHSLATVHCHASNACQNKVGSRKARPSTQMLSEKDMLDLESSTEYLNDNHINVAQRILRKQFPEARGLQDTLLQQTSMFDVQEGPFIQIFHTHNHWITVARENNKQIKIYDSLHRFPDQNIIQIIAKYIHSDDDDIEFVVMNNQRQGVLPDCGPFAVAFATSLLYGEDPTQIQYEESQVRRHLRQCIETQNFIKFPSHPKVRKTTFGISVKVGIHCVCRCPEDGQLMTECRECNLWFHAKCVGLNMQQQQREELVKSWLCPKCSCMTQQHVTDIQSLKNELAATRAEVTQMKQMMRSLQNECNATRAENVHLLDNVDELRCLNTALVSDIAQMKQMVNQLKAEVEALKRQSPPSLHQTASTSTPTPGATPGIEMCVAGPSTYQQEPEDRESHQIRNENHSQQQQPANTPLPVAVSPTGTTPGAFIIPRDSQNQQEGSFIPVSSSMADATLQGVSASLGSLADNWVSSVMGHKGQYFVYQNPIISQATPNIVGTEANNYSIQAALGEGQNLATNQLAHAMSVASDSDIIDMVKDSPVEVSETGSDEMIISPPHPS